MILAALLAALSTPHPREHPVTAVEWLDHYHYCLDVNFRALADAAPPQKRADAARRATVRCWPVRSSAKSKVVEELGRDGRERSADGQHEVAERMLTIVASAFALDVGVTLGDLGALSPR
jgi:hypothetical protein